MIDSVASHMPRKKKKEVATMARRSKRRKHIITRVSSVTFTPHSGFLCVSIGDKVDVESTVFIWYRNIIRMYDGDDLRFGNTAPLKTMYVETKPDDYFMNLCALANLMDGDNLRRYITDNGNSSEYYTATMSLVRASAYELGNMIGFSSQIITRLRTEIEDYAEYSSTPWRRVKMWIRRVTHPEDFIPSKPKKKEPPKPIDKSKTTNIVKKKPETTKK